MAINDLFSFNNSSYFYLTSCKKNLFFFLLLIIYGAINQSCTKEVEVEKIVYEEDTSITSDLRNQISRLENQINSLQSANSDLRNRLTIAESNLSSSTNHINDLSNTIESLTSSNSSLISTNSNLVSQLNTLISQNTALEAELEDLTASLNTSTSTNESLTSQVTSLNERIQELQDQISSLEYNIAIEIGVQDGWYTGYIGNNKRYYEIESDSVKLEISYNQVYSSIAGLRERYKTTTNWGSITPTGIGTVRITNRGWTFPARKIHRDSVPDSLYQIYGESINSDSLVQIYRNKGYGIYSDSIYANINYKDPSSYLNAFILDGNRHGLDLSYVNDEEFRFEVVDLDRGVAYGITCANFVYVGWEDEFIPEVIHDIGSDQLHTFWHEFGHSILNLEHTCNRTDIMWSTDNCFGETITVDYTLEPSNSYTAFFNGVDRIFNESMQYPDFCGYATQKNTQNPIIGCSFN